KMFTLAITTTMMVLVPSIGAETLLPFAMQAASGFTPLKSTLMPLPGAIVIRIRSPITRRLSDRWAAKWPARSCRGLLSITRFLFTHLSAEATFAYLAIVDAIRMFGLALTLMRVMTSALNQMPPKWYSHGSALANTLQQISAAMGTAFLVTLTAMGAKAY